MKKFLFLLICIFIIFALLGCDDTAQRFEITPPADKTPAIKTTEGLPVSPSPSEIEYLHTETTGTIPNFINASISNNDNLIDSIKTKNGYLLCRESSSEIQIEKYDINNVQVWSKHYADIPENFRASYHLELTSDGFLFFYYVTTMNAVNPVPAPQDVTLIKCDENGEIIWTEKYNDLTIESVFEAENEDIYMFSQIKDNEKFDIQISKFDKNRKLIFEKALGGSDDDFVRSAWYMKDIGILAEISTGSTDGPFKMLSETQSTGLLVMFDMDMNIIWQKASRNNFSNATIYNDSIYVTVNSTSYTSSSFNLYKINENGEFDYTKNLDNQHSRIVGCNDIGLILYSYNETSILDTSGETKLSLFNKNGYPDDTNWFCETDVIRTMNYDNFFLTISRVNYFYFPNNYHLEKSEIVYTGYDYNGNVIWQKAVDRTDSGPEYPQVMIPGY